MRSIILIIFAILLAGTCQAQWPQGKGHAYTKLGTWNQHSTTHFEDNGRVVDAGEDGLRTYFIPGFYGRFGLDDKWTFTAFVPVVNTTQGLETTAGNTTLRGTHLGDINLSLERLILKLDAGLHVGAELTLGLPTGEGVSIVGSGDGEFNQMLAIKAGSGFKIGEQGLYYKLSAGLNNRTKGFSDEFRYSVETGGTFGKIFLLSRITNITSLNNKPQQFGNGSIFGDRIEKTVLGFEGTYNINKHWGISAGYNRFLKGSYVFNAPSYTYGIIYQY